MQCWIPRPTPGRDKSGPYAIGIASLAGYGHFATNITLSEPAYYNKLMYFALWESSFCERKADPLLHFLSFSGILWMSLLSFVQAVVSQESAPEGLLF